MICSTCISALCIVFCYYLVIIHHSIFHVVRRTTKTAPLCPAVLHIADNFFANLLIHCGRVHEFTDRCNSAALWNLSHQDQSSCYFRRDLWLQVCWVWLPRAINVFSIRTITQCAATICKPTETKISWTASIGNGHGIDVSNSLPVVFSLKSSLINCIALFVGLFSF